MTLGIPRLRELFMTATKSIKTPVMTLPLLPGKTKEDAEVLANNLRRIRLAEVCNPTHPPLAIWSGVDAKHIPPPPPPPNPPGDPFNTQG